METLSIASWSSDCCLSHSRKEIASSSAAFGWAQGSSAPISAASWSRVAISWSISAWVFSEAGKVVPSYS